jgi:pilus assembly protein CpaB
VQPGSFNDPKTLSGPGRVSVKAIAAGEPITEQKLVPPAGSAGAGFMTYIVPPGHRAVTVAVNEVAGVAGFLTPNNKIDVVLTTPIPGSANENISKIVLQNVPILATGQIAQEQKDGKPVVVPTVTLDLTPDDAEKLVLAASKGSLQLLLRNFSDASPVAARGATIGKVLMGVSRPEKPATAAAAPVRIVRLASPRKAAKAPSSVYSVEVIRGTERSTKQFTPAGN